MKPHYLLFRIFASLSLQLFKNITKCFPKKSFFSAHFGPSLVASLEPLAHRRSVASLSLFYRYYFGRCSSELTQLVPLPFSRGKSTCYSDRSHDFSVTIPRCYKDVYVNSFFPCIARLWNSVPVKCLPLNYDLSCFESRIKRYLLTVNSVNSFNRHLLAVQPCM